MRSPSPKSADTPPPSSSSTSGSCGARASIQRPWWAATWIWGDGSHHRRCARGATHATSDPDIYRPLGNDRRGGGQNLEVLCRLSESSTLAALDAELAGLTEVAREARLANERAARAYSAIVQARVGGRLTSSGAPHADERGGLSCWSRQPTPPVCCCCAPPAVDVRSLLARRSGRRRDGSRAHWSSKGSCRGSVRRAWPSGGAAAVRGLLSVAASVLRRPRGIFDRWRRNRGSRSRSARWSVSPSRFRRCSKSVRVNLRDTLQEEGRSGTAGRSTQWMRQALIGGETACYAPCCSSARCYCCARS